MWRNTVVLHLDDIHHAFGSGTLIDSEIRYLSILTEVSSVYRFKLFKVDGTVFWSTRASDIVTVTTKPYFKQVVAHGEIFYSQQTKPAPEIDGSRLTQIKFNGPQLRQVVEIYTPILNNGRFVGAIELYTDVTELRQILLTRFRFLLLLVTSIAILSIVIVSLVIYNSNRFRLRQIKQQNVKEHENTDRQLRLAREVRLLGELNECL